MKDSEESYTSQAESVVSQTSSRQQRSAYESSPTTTTETTTHQTITVEELKASRRENVENVEILNIEWQRPKVVTPHPGEFCVYFLCCTRN